jgi:hypothetical protein
MLADRTVALHESSLRLSQGFFQSYMEQLQSQTQGNREAAQNLQEQSQRPRGFESSPLRSSIHGQTATKDTNTNEGPEPRRTPAFRSDRFFGYFLVSFLVSLAPSSAPAWAAP